MTITEIIPENGIKNIHTKKPLIQCITNYITANDVANIILACGASPIMTDNPEEASQIASISDGIYINMGTLNDNAIKSMIEAGKTANKENKVVLLDPVGIGASNLRNQTAKLLMENIKFDVIRGNISEIKALYNGNGNTKGVDAAVEDEINENNIDDIVDDAIKLAEKTNAIIVISGVIDIVAGNHKACLIRNGHSMMSSITGSGCQLSGLITAFAAANKEELFGAVAMAVCTMGVSGEKAYKRMSADDGNSTYRNYLIDAVYNCTQEIIYTDGNIKIYSK